MQVDVEAFKIIIAELELVRDILQDPTHDQDDLKIATDTSVRVTAFAKAMLADYRLLS